MKSSDIMHFLSLLHAQNIELSHDGTWIKSSCPLAPWTHEDGEDTNPSFGIKVNENGLSSYNCFACGSGSILKLIHLLVFTVGMSAGAMEFFTTNEIFDEPQIDELPAPDGFKELFSIGKRKKKPIVGPIPEMVLSLYPDLEFGSSYNAVRAQDWFEDRLISKDIWQDYKIKFEPTGHGIIFPVIDISPTGKHEYYHLHVRLRTEKTFYYIRPHIFRGQYPAMPDWGRSDSWFGIQFYDTRQPVTLVESETDVLRLRTLGMNNVIASHGPVNQDKFDRVRSNIVYIGFDSDSRGARYTMKAMSGIECELMYRLSWHKVGCNDAGDLDNENQLREVLTERRLLMRGGEVATKIGLKEFDDKFKTACRHSPTP